MRLLHITATHLNLAGGIPVVLRDLVSAQNTIENFEARVLSIKADTSAMNSEFFDFLGDETFEEYIDNYKPEVVVFHSHYYFEYLRFYRNLVKRNIPYFIEPHGSFGKAALQKSRLKKKIANGIILRTFMKKAQGYIFLNKVEKSDAQFTTNHDLVIPNGIDGEKIVRKICPQEPWSFYFIGRFDKSQKGLDILFDALEMLDKKRETVSVKLYGKGTDEEVSNINHRISNLHSVTVINCGPIYGDEQLSAIEQCGVMLLTSRYEGFPMTVLEAWKYGNPCLVTPGTNVADEIVENGLGWKTELNAEDIAKTISLGLSEYSQQRIEYINRCKDYVREKYDWKEIAKLSLVQLSKGGL
ncbi:glycosyltransferase [Faecalibaculum rodentium]|jgi:glycosyltransferase involved in cell wall biosynthesis|uniref:glycosyltransferase n=1 Tax=Faecalibaculum rodentium TaxID=1702221 RepID=UPI0025707E65|nr:glycosyltransferase [Faecalibaculum rodentium]